jgi:ankyrin repeat protein
MRNRALISTLILALVVLIITGRCATTSDIKEEKESANQEAFFQAVGQGNVAEAKRLIEAGADVNAQDNRGYTALIRASGWRYTEIVKLLIEAGADVNAKAEWNGRTALIHASASGDEYIETVKLLIEAGADVNAQDKYGYTALMAASQEGYEKVTKLLIEEGADVNAQNFDGITALMFAEKMGHTEIVQALLETGVDVYKFEFPKPIGWINDFASVIDEKSKNNMQRIITDLERKTGAEVAVVTVKTISPYKTIEEYAIDLAIEWGIGKKGEDNGILLLITMKEREIRIEIGYGLVDIISDDRAGQILDESIIPFLRDEKYGQGLLNGVEVIANIINIQY